MRLEQLIRPKSLFIAAFNGYRNHWYVVVSLDAVKTYFVTRREAIEFITAVTT